MDWYLYLSSFFIGLILRLGIPIAITVLLIWLVRRLDESWQEEGTGARVMAKNPGCWKIMGCSEERKAKCEAYANPDMPCWQYYRDSNGRLREGCIGCKIFREATVPVSV